ncbi:MAG: macro domain-containing protein [Alphaproteobacteria bacterium]|nr:macro domain-containing protein [Alphaproteobacteria bacterium]
MVAKVRSLTSSSSTAEYFHEEGSTVAFPAISTGVYGFPADLAAEIATRETATFLDGCQDIESVVLVAFDTAAAAVLTAALRRTAVRSSTGRR